MKDDLGPLDAAPAFLVYRMGRLLQHNLRAVLRDADVDVTPEQYFLLYKLFREDGVPQSSLADRVLGDYPNITRLIDGLVKKQYVERQSDPSDRRRFLIFLTEQGRQIMRSMAPAIRSQRNRLFGAFSEEETTQFVDYIRRLEQQLE